VLCERLMRELPPAGDDMRLANRHADHLGVVPQKQAGLHSVGLAMVAGRLTSILLDGGLVRPGGEGAVAPYKRASLPYRPRTLVSVWFFVSFRQGCMRSRKSRDVLGPGP
jgi:hypothetical protein